MTFFVLFFSQHLGSLEPQNTAKQGKRENDKSTLFYRPTRGGYLRETDTMWQIGVLTAEESIGPKICDLAGRGGGGVYA